MIVPLLDVNISQQWYNLVYYGAVERLVILPFVLLLVPFDPGHHPSLGLVLLDVQRGVQQE